MRERLNIKQIIKENPRIDARKLKEGMELLEELRRAGLPRPRYRLAPPFERRRITLTRDILNDPRTIHLPHR